jgi:hypothetical protein
MFDWQLPRGPGEDPSQVAAWREGEALTLEQAVDEALRRG